MSITPAVRLLDRLPPIGSDPSDVIDGFSTWATETGRPLYPHQEDAALALASGSHVVLATPTGSGKSMAAIAGIVLARNAGRRSVWTAPIKALVAEKFFELVELLGPEEVGLAIGDASINRDGAVLVCTSEVLANLTLGDAFVRGDAPGFACLDEFHYYADSDRGWAWQVPLLIPNDTQFLLASATLGDVTPIVEDLAARTGVTVEQITSVNRPIPLYPEWRNTPLAESVVDAVERGLYPVYLVHSTQAAAVEQAQSLVSLPLTTREQREAIAAAVKGEKLTTGFGQTLARYLRNGVGVHHAGMLPRYRRLVEKLAGEGLLAVICGTDTLGVGINIPIRTVLFSALTKFDGQKVRVLKAREFHQLSGRAGRPGFDPDGHVWAQAPEHIIETNRALARAGDDPKAQRKVKRAPAPKGFIHFDENTFNRLLAASPEPLVSRFRVSPNLVSSVLARPDGPVVLKELLRTNHDTPAQKRAHKKRAIHVYRSLEAAGVAERLRADDGSCAGVRVGSLVDDGTNDRVDVRFASPLGPFAIEVLSTFDRDDPAYVLDVVSVVESIIENPKAILFAQEKAARGLEIARMKASGVPYEERMDNLDGITWTKPLAEILDSCIELYRRNHPWVWDDPEPKSILREMLETGETFTGFIRRYKLERSEGLLLRYLTDAWRTLDRSLANDSYNDALEDVIEWLRLLLSATDASLIDEWTRLSGGEVSEHHAIAAPKVASGPPPAWRTSIRTAAFGWVELLARKAYPTFGERVEGSPPWWDVANSLADYWAEHETIETTTEARSAAFFSIDESVAGVWTITQRFCDPEGDGDWRIVATVDLARAEDEGGPTLVFRHLGRIGLFGDIASAPTELDTDQPDELASTSEGDLD